MFQNLSGQDALTLTADDTHKTMQIDDMETIPLDCYEEYFVQNITIVHFQ